jgi:hypothetical protein
MRAPLMRLLTLPLWPAGGLRSLFGGREPEPPVRIVRREVPGDARVAADHQLGAPANPAPAAALDVAPQLYRRWCLDGTPPRIPDALEVSPLRYAGEETPAGFASPVHTFRDDPRAGDFVRFSPRGAGVGVAFPNPLGQLSEEKRQSLFPDLPAAALEDREQLASIRPVPIQRRPDGTWVRV